MNKLYYLTICLCLFSAIAKSQEHTEHKEANEAVNRPHHRITIVMENVHLPKELAYEGTKKNLILPAWGIDYDYWFNGKWGIGLHNDLIIQEYKVEEKEGNTELIRNHPWAVSLVGLFKATEHWGFVGGIGREFEKNESINLFELGLEYGFELPKDWELSLNLKYENKLKAYDSWLFGIGISKVLYKHR